MERYLSLRWDLKYVAVPGLSLLSCPGLLRRPSGRMAVPRRAECFLSSAETGWRSRSPGRHVPAAGSPHRAAPSWGGPAAPLLPSGARPWKGAGSRPTRHLGQGIPLLFVQGTQLRAKGQKGGKVPRAAEEPKLKIMLKT